MAVTHKILRDDTEVFADPTAVNLMAEIGTVVKYSGNHYVKVGPGHKDWLLSTKSPEALALPPTETSGTVTLTYLHSYVGFDTSGGTGTLNLLQASTCVGKIVIVKKLSLANLVTVNAFAGDTVEGLSSLSFSDLNEVVIFQSVGGTNWRILGRYRPSLASFFRQSVPEELYINRFPDIDGNISALKTRVVRETVFNFDDTRIRLGRIDALVKFGGVITIPGDTPGRLQVRIGGTEAAVDGTLVADVAMPNSAFNAYQAVRADFTFTPPSTGLLFVKLILVTPDGPNTKVMFSFARGINLGFEKS